MTDPGAAGTDPYEPDVAAAAERTRLAWRRTGLAVTAVALLAVRPVFRPDADGTAVLVTTALLAGWALLVALAWRRTRRLIAYPPRPAYRTISLYAMITFAVALIGGLVVTL